MLLILMTASLNDSTTQPFCLLTKDVSDHFKSDRKVVQRADQCRHLLTLWALHEFTSTLYKAQLRCNLDAFPRNPSTARPVERFLNASSKKLHFKLFPSVVS